MDGGLTDQIEQSGFPHLVDIIVFFHFENPDASFWRFFPHRHLITPEKEHIEFSRQL